LIFPPISFARITLGAKAAASVDDQSVVEVAADGLEIEHADLDMSAKHSNDELQGAWLPKLGHSNHLNRDRPPEPS
jgi:hypothetical protein